MSQSELLSSLREAIIRGDISEAEQLAEQAIADGIDPLLTFDKGLHPGITEVGDGFASGKYFLPDLVIAAEAMQTAAAVLEREITRTGAVREKIGKVVLGTVEGDLHDIGKTIVGTLMASHGFDIVDLGVNVPADDFVKAVREHNPQILGLSSLLTLTTKQIENAVEVLKDEGLRDSVKVMIGGGAVTQEFADEIEIDGFARDAEIGVRIAKKLMEVEV
jgi:corrinoid protein of di/trimethylamine methyltransferase|tara:strand:- start:553 stop:1209 length:657 start_codon:yes stop_codon:yes gene_type:complete